MYYIGIPTLQYAVNGYPNFWGGKNVKRITTQFSSHQYPVDTRLTTVDRAYNYELNTCLNIFFFF